MRIWLLTALIPLAGCSVLNPDGPDNYNLSTIVGNAPVHERHKKIPPNGFYIEELGNGFSNHKTLAVFFDKKAADLCLGKVKAVNRLNGTRYPDAKLPGNKMSKCTDPFCNKVEEHFPLVYGTVECEDEEKTSHPTEAR